MIMLDNYRKIVVTGGAGFIGSNFVRYVLKNDYDGEIVILDNLTYASSYETISDLISDKIKFYRVDVSDMFSLKQYVDATVDLIVHFAAESFNDKSLINVFDFVNTNIIGTFNILELCKEYDIRLHHISTDEVYGDFPLESKDKFSETTAYNPSSPYSATKASADLLVKAWVKSFDVRATISNCSNNYGPYQNPEKFIPRQITNILSGQRPVLYGLGLNVRDWIHVEDHCKAICLIIEKGGVGDTYMIGIDNEQTNSNVLQKILNLMNKSSSYYDYIADRKGHDLRYGIDATKLITELGFEPDYKDFDESLKSTIKWYELNQNWWKKLIEKKEGLN